MQDDRQVRKERSTGLRGWMAEQAALIDELAETIGPVAPILAAALAFGGGLALMVTGAFPATNATREALRGLLPLPFVEASHLSASLSGLALMVVARGLYLRMAKARVAATLLLAAGAVFALVRSLDWREAALLSFAALVLTLGRDEFYRRDDWSAFRPDWRWITLIAAAVGAAVLIGLVAHRNVAYRNDLWWSFAWHGDAPRFLRASLALAAALAALGLDRLLNQPVPMRRAPPPIPEAVRAIVARSADCARHLALLGDKQFLLSPRQDAFLMYGVSGRSWICLAGPVGAPEAFDALIWDFADRADRAGGRAVFCSIQGEMTLRLLDLGHAVAKMGEMARVNLDRFSLDGPTRKDLRYALSRARREGLEFSVLPRADVPAHLPELAEISDAWLGRKQGGEKGFVLGYFSPTYLSNFDHAVMRRAGRIVAFANIWRGAGQAEFGIDLMRYLHGEPPALMEAFFVELMLYAKAEGYHHFLLGGAPMSGLPTHRLAPFWARLGNLIYRHGEDFYNFGGLRAFKEKFGAEWTPLYLTCPSNLSLPRVLYDVAILVTRRHDLGG